MGRTGMDMETVFRHVYHLPPEADLFQLIEAAITVVAHKKTEEFMIRRTRIAEQLFKNPRDANYYKTEEDDEATDADHGDGDHNDECGMKKHEQQGIVLTKRIQHGGNEKVEKKLNEHGVSKFERIGRKLAESYQAAQQKKRKISCQAAQQKKRKIQMVDIKDLPPKYPCSSNRRRPTNGLNPQPGRRMLHA